MQTIKITTSQNIDIDYQLADIGDRILARLLDYVVFAGLSIVVLIIFGIFSGLINYYSDNGTNMGTYIMIGLWLLLCVLYDLICEIFFNGQSVGKRTMKIKVISLNGARPRVHHSAARPDGKSPRQRVATRSVRERGRRRDRSQRHATLKS